MDEGASIDYTQLWSSAELSRDETEGPKWTTVHTGQNDRYQKYTVQNDPTFMMRFAL